MGFKLPTTLGLKRGKKRKAEAFKRGSNEIAVARLAADVRGKIVMRLKFVVIRELCFQKRS